MNSGATSERVYDALKRRICEGRYHPGERLEAAAIGKDLASSITPVRDALYRLLGEGLVVTRTSSGFHLPALDSPGLEDLYRWNVAILTLATRATARIEPSRSVADVPPEVDAAALFGIIAARSANGEHRRTIASINDRLEAVRRVEATVLDECETELSGLASVVATRDAEQIRQAVVRYHRRRIRRAADIVRVLHREAELGRAPRGGSD